jgi:integrase
MVDEDYSERTLEHPWVKSILAADVSKNTKEQYVRNSITLQRLAGGRTLETIISHPKSMLRRIDTAYESNQTRKSLMSTVKAYVKYNPELKETYAEAIEIWSDAFRVTDKAITERVATAQPTQRELMNWVEWGDVLKKQHELGFGEYASITHLLVSMYSLIEPIRADYGNIRIVREGGEEPQSENYVLLSPMPGRSKLVLHSYKTSKRYGMFQRDLPAQLVNIIETSLKKFPRTFLFVDESGHPYTKRNSYTRFANRTFERLFGKKFTISLMRHSFVSNLDFNEATPAKLFQHSKNMMHSIGMQQMYRRKVVPELAVKRVSTSGDRYIMI